ncbi:dTDP-4-dehydrorhamnose reductase [Flavobacterium chryseum]|uniref:dTDP-4-dehydrorhamnose reductase family protein n=1 Tax=Flavobacterium sp. P3160 TaxID=2512113 RepID=UPI00106087BB|nr:SDR family oxidoreductase [Flavobacterium sp. P3160]TDO77450.1 dTDP-4-dehydrorhamnose reductase [Flavobacterium sp. P3160]
MKKVLVLGAKGMAGHVVLKLLPQLGSYDVWGIARNIDESDRLINLDVKNTDKLSAIVASHNFDCIINCIGILNKEAEDNPDKAIWFNSYFPHFIESITRNTSTKVIHISTDCVFSGKMGAYTENDLKDGYGFYAQSKNLGELDNNKDLTLRTSIIGPEVNENGIGLFHWFMSQNNDVELKGFTHAFWSGITTIELTKTIHAAIEQNITGLIQITQKNKIDKYSLLQLFNTIFKSGLISIRPNSDYHVDKSMVSIRTDFNYKTPEYDAMLLEMKQWIEQNNYKY